MVLEVGATPEKSLPKITVRQLGNADLTTGPRSVDEPVLADIHPNMRYAPPAVGGKKDEVSPFQFFPVDGAAVIELPGTVSWQIQAVETINHHCQAAAVEAVARRFPAPAIRYTEKSTCRRHQFGSQISFACPFNTRGGMFCRGDDKKIIDLTFLFQPKGLTPGYGMIFVIPEPDLVEAGLMEKGIGVYPQAEQPIFQPDGIALTGKSADLDGVAELLQLSGIAA